MFTGLSGNYGGIESQQVRLFCHLVNNREDGADIPRFFGEGHNGVRVIIRRSFDLGHAGDCCFYRSFTCFGILEKLLGDSGALGSILFNLSDRRVHGGN